MGVVDLSGLRPEDRAAPLVAVLRATPSPEDFALACAEADVSEPALSFWTREVASLGWDGAAKGAREAWTKAKGAWEGITGTAYGADKAVHWVPVAFDPADDGVDLNAALTDAREALDEALRARGADAAERSALEHQAQAPRPDTGALTAAVTQAEAALDQARADLEAAPALPDEQPVLACPCCGAVLVHTRGPDGDPTLRRPEEVLDPVEIEARRTTRRTLGKALREAEHALEQARAALRRGLEHTDRIEKAVAALAALPAGTGDAAAVEAARATLSRWERAHQARQTLNQANEQAARAQSAAAIYRILAPGGLRRRKLADVLSLFNERLAAFCAAADWPKPVRVAEDMSLWEGPYPQPLVSASGAWRIRVALQLCTAALDKSEVVLIDGAEILDARSRSGLLQALADQPFRSLVALTATIPRSLPDLAALGLGASYWIADGVARLLADALQEEAQHG